MLKKLLIALVTILFVCYPFIIYYGLQQWPVSAIAGVIFLLLMARLFFMRAARKQMPWLIPVTLISALFALHSLFAQSTLGIKLYPVVVNSVMLFMFALSYLKKPTIIEQFARLTHDNLTDKSLVYLDKVTLVWCLFFFMNGAISLYTVLWGTEQQWLIYNGLIAYIAMGSLMAVEFIVRQFAKKQHQTS